MEDSDTTSSNHKWILVLDDEFDIVTVIKKWLRRNGFTVYGFTDPYLAFEHFKINYEDYCLVLCDIRMPGMKGIEFAGKVKEIKPKIYVLLMTAFEIRDSNFSIDFPSTNVEGFIQKPVSLKELNSLIRKYIDTEICQKP